jgi:hypothetical protein
VRPDGGYPLTLVGLADIGSEHLAQAALELAVTYVDGVVQLAGTPKTSTILIIIDARIENCGQAFSEVFVVRIRPNCVNSNVVVHELTHLATPVVLATWFEEGTAYWAAQHLTRTQADSQPLESAQLRRETTFDTDCCDERDDAYTSTVRGGAAFWYDLELIIGDEAVGHAIKAVPEGVGREAIPAIIRFTPADRQAAVRSLITERCREYRQGRMLPCTIPAR